MCQHILCTLEKRDNIFDTTIGDSCLRIDNVCDGEDTCKVNPNRGIKGPKVKN